MAKLRVLGITSGIGSMLVGARQAGFKPVGNIEWRKYYHQKDEKGRNTFLENFKGTFMVEKIDDLTEEQLTSVKGIDLAMGHPECGHFSRLNAVNKGAAEHARDPGDIPLFVELLSIIKPRYFAMDDLPLSLMHAYPMEKYHELLPEYDLFPEWISNYHYGNPQLNRKRFFMLGALKSEKFVFVPGEEDVEPTVKEALAGLTSQTPNMEPHTLKAISQRGVHLDHYGDRPDWKRLQAHFKEQPEGYTFHYHGPNGYKRKPGMSKSRWDGHSFVIDGASPTINPKTNLPFRIRERARLQGFPDDFIFYGTKLSGRSFDHEKNYHMVKQTGKAMPIQFNRYFAKQVKAHIEGKKFKASGERKIQPNPYIGMAKTWFCDNVGYADQRGACSQCWLFQSCESKRCQRPIPLDFGFPGEKKK